VDDLLLQARHELVTAEGERERLARETEVFEARKEQANAEADAEIVHLAAMRAEKGAGGRED